MSQFFMFDPWGRLFPLASSIIIKSSYRALLTTEQLLSGDGCLRGTSVNQRLVEALLHFHLQSTTKKLMNLIHWNLVTVLMLVRYGTVRYVQYACKSAGIYMQHACALTCTHKLCMYFCTQRLSLWHSSYPFKDFHMPVTDVIPVPALLNVQHRAKIGKWASWRRVS